MDAYWQLGMMLLLVGTAAGCSADERESQLTCVPARGELFVGGLPASGAELVFQPTNVDPTGWPAGYPRATVDEKGAFVIETNQETKGAPEGEYLVLVTWMTAAKPPSGERPSDDYAPYDRFRGKFSNPATAKLRAKISAPETVLPRFNL